MNNINWERAADGTATELRQNTISGFPVWWKYSTGIGRYWATNKGEWIVPQHECEFVVIATRPKPPLSPEQIEAVKEYRDWYFQKHQDVNDSSPLTLEAFLKERGDE